MDLCVDAGSENMLEADTSHSNMNIFFNRMQRTISIKKADCNASCNVVSWKTLPADVQQQASADNQNLSSVRGSSLVQPPSPQFHLSSVSQVFFLVFAC